MVGVVVPASLLPNNRAVGVKPVGKVAIDWNHPSTLGLKMHFLPKVSGDIANAVDGHVYVRDSAQSITPASGGLASTCSTARHYLSTGSYNPLPVGTGDFSVMARIAMPAKGVNQGLIYASRNASAPNNGFYFRTNAYYADGAGGSTQESGTIWFGGFDATSSANARGVRVQNILTGGPQTFLATRKGLVYSMYLDGALVGTSTAALNTDVSNGTDFQSIGGWPDADSIPFNEDIYSIAGWDRAISAGEASELTRDPYQFLREVF